jgi:PAS domain S-box-containing protein
LKVHDLRIVITLKKLEPFQMPEKPMYEELAKRVKDLEQEKLQANLIKGTLIKSDEWLSAIIDLKTSPETSPIEVDLGAVINAEEIQSIMDDFCALTNMVTAILDLKGKVIESTGWQDICTKFHYKNPQARKNCSESELLLAKSLKRGEYVDYKCKNGLTDVVTPLYVGSKHFGNVYTGQFFYDDEEIDEEVFLKQAEKFGFDKESYIEALRRVPRYSRKKIDYLMSFLIKFSTYISKISLANIQLEQEMIERKHAEEALKEKTKFLDQIIESSALSMWISDEKGTAIRTNPACLEFFGATEKEVVGKYNLFKDVVIEKKGFMPTVKDVFEKGKPVILVIDYDFGAVDHVDVKNATHKIIKTVLTPVLDNNKKVSNVIVQTIDLTEIKQAEAEKLMAQKITDENRKQALIGRIAGKMAHDFNNILGIIMGNAELALIDCPDDQTKKSLDLIYNQTIRGKNLTKNLVAFAKDQEPKQEFFSIDEKIDLVLNLLRKDLDGINVIRQYDHGIPELLADSGMIEHAIVNLVQNSIHAVSLVERPQIIFRIYHQGEFIFFEIEDNGCGIPLEFLGEIYEPSFTLKGSKDKNGMYKPGIKGTGYGMSNVKRYIEQHKGNISIHSELQKGTKVTIKLPVIKKELTFDEIANVKKGKIFFEKYILLVEDEQAISDIQYRILTHEPCNHKVDIANNGQVAIDLLNRNKYDLISLDYVLPGKFNGMDIYHHVREINKAVPVLFISGNIEFLESIKDLKQKDPYIDHLSKPCKNIDYINCINKLFRSVAI